MANYIDKFTKIVPYTPIQRGEEPVALIKTPQQQAKTEALGTNVLEKFLQNKGVIAAPQVKAPVATTNISNDVKPNNLRTMFKNNEAVIMGIIMRTFGAKDKSGNQLLRGDDVRGNFNNAIERLDELKNLGVNTLHVLPVNPPGKMNAMGTAGSLYAPEDFLKIDPALDDPNDPKDVREEFKNFINECHKRGIRVMLDLPSCASYDLFLARP